MKNLTCAQACRVTVLALFTACGVLVAQQVGMGQGRAAVAAQNSTQQRPPVVAQHWTDPVLAGAFDIHAHVDPDAFGPQQFRIPDRQIDIFDLAKMAKSRGIRGFVAKMHHGNTAGLAYEARKLYPGVEVVGMLSSNLPQGGINPAAVRFFADTKGGFGRMVFMPTLDSENDVKKSTDPSRPFVPVSKNGELVPVAKEVLSIMARARTRESNGELVLATGHVSAEEGLMLVKEGQRVGLKHMVVSHPLISFIRMPLPMMQEAVKTGAYLEITAGFSRGANAQKNTKEVVETIRAVGVDHIIISTDSGGKGTPFVPDAFVMAARALRAQGFNEREVNQLFKENPARLMGLPITSAPASAQYTKPSGASVNRDARDGMSVKSLVAGALCVASLLWLSAIGSALIEAMQLTRPGQSVWEGVYTDAQAARGQAFYTTTCLACHGDRLQGVAAPALAGPLFLEHWREDTLQNLFFFVKTRMPPDFQRLRDDAYLDILALILRTNGMPPGQHELQPGALKDIQLIGREGPRQIPDGALVVLIGCLARQSDLWSLTRATDPVRNRQGDGASAEELASSVSVALGRRDFALRNMEYALRAPNFRPESAQGHRILLKGNLIRQPRGGERVDVTWLGAAAEICR
jgi:mono/diheme cytochrome c family protein